MKDRGKSAMIIQVCSGFVYSSLGIYLSDFYPSMSSFSLSLQHAGGSGAGQL